MKLALSQVLGWQGQTEEGHYAKARKSGQGWLFNKKKSTEIQNQDVRDGRKAEVRAKGAGVSQPGEGTEAVPGD